VTPADEGTFAGVGDREIFWRCWRPEGDPTAVVALAHGFGEHSGRYDHVGRRLAAGGFVVYALDHHGHGRSAGPRARISLSDAVADLDQLITLAGSHDPQLEVFLLGHSMGGAIALRYAMAHQSRLAGLILSGPLAAIDGRGAAKVIGRLLGAIAPGLPVTKIDPAQVSRDPAVVSAYVDDPLVFHGAIPAGTVAEFLRHVESLPEDVSRITVPTLVMYGTADALAAPSGAVMVSERIGAPDITTTAYDGLYHEILNEPEQDAVLGEILAWIDAHRLS
jgi:alpha-beta hydrolase superfamily lysophospholipase